MAADVSRFDKFIKDGKYPFVDEIVDKCGSLFSLKELALVFSGVLGITKKEAHPLAQKFVVSIREFLIEHQEIEFLTFCKLWYKINLIAICEPNKIRNGRVYRRDKKKFRQKFTRKYKDEIERS